MDKERFKLFNAGLKQLTSSLDICLWPGSECEGKAIRAHSVQKRKVLEQLCENGHVVMPRLKLSAKQPPTFIFDLVGRNKATTFTGLCATHDSKLFKEIDDEKLDANNKSHLFLMAYRSVLREAHSSRKSAIDTQLTYQEGVKRGIYPNEPCAPEELAAKVMMAAYIVDEVKMHFDQAFLCKNYKNLSHFPITLDVGPTIAVSSIFSTSLWCESTDSLAFVILNVFPNHQGISEVVFSCITEHEPQVKRFISPILEASGHYRLYLLSKLILEKCENMVISPVLFESYSQQQRDIIAHYFERSTFDHAFDADSEHLYLFGPVH